MIKNLNLTEDSASKKSSRSNYFKIGEIIIVVICLFIMTILFWHLMAYLVQAIKKFDKMIKS